MNVYNFLKNSLFLLPPELSHQISLKAIKWANKINLTSLIASPIPSCPHPVMGLTFPNPIGLAAGLDKNGDYIDALGALGFGFIEIGTITPKPQPGNPRPRLFRLTKEMAIINRMGFNNKGALHALNNLRTMTYQGIIGVNIGKNKDTPLENAVDDYVFCFRKLAPYASYITINISSPNTAGLRELQQTNLLTQLLATLKKEQDALFIAQQKYVPLVVKIAPDLPDKEIVDIATLLIMHHIDGVIATNTTLSRHGVETSSYYHETGGLSGKPLSNRSTHVIKQLQAVLQNKIPIIASGGVMDKKSAQEKIKVGANLLQIYTGFIYTGPILIKELSDAYKGLSRENNGM